MKLKCITLKSDDIGVSKEFWGEVIGLAICGEYENQLVFKAGEVEILIDASEDAISVKTEIIFACEKEEFENIVVRAKTAKSRIARPENDWGGPLGREITLEDPFNNFICLYIDKNKNS